MNNAAQLAAKLETVEGEDGFELIEACHEGALDSFVSNDTMLLMHADGSVNIVEMMGSGGVTVEVISAANILKVLHHYRPFKDVFKGGIQ